MLRNHPVKINVATEAEISQLYDIGPELARRIVEHRQAQGYFDGPDRLAAVEGVSLDLALTLAPHIDWQAPLAPEPLKQREWGNALAFLFGAFATFWVLNRSLLSKLYYAIAAFRGAPSDYVFLWITGSLCIALGSVVLSFVCWVVEALLRTPASARWFDRAGTVLTSFFFLGAVSSGLGNAIYYQFYAPDGWVELFRDEAAMAGIAAFFLIAGVFGPHLLVLYNPALRFRSQLARTYDIAWTVAGPVLAWVTWAARDLLPLWYLIALGVVGVGSAFIGFKILTTRQSTFEASLSFLDPRVLERAPETSFWKTWINSRLPNAEQQKELKKALDELHPPSRARTISGLLIFGAGGWIIATALGSVMDWIIQNWLNTLPLFR